MRLLLLKTSSWRDVKFVSAPRQDAAFNKTSRSLQDLQQKDLGVKPEFRSVQPEEPVVALRDMRTGRLHIMELYLLST